MYDQKEKLLYTIKRLDFNYYNLNQTNWIKVLIININAGKL